MLEQITKFENQLAQFTGAPYVIATDCCTHAIEIALRHRNPASITSSAFTYLSIPMLFHKLKINYTLTDLTCIAMDRYNVLVSATANQ